MFSGLQIETNDKPLHAISLSMLHKSLVLLCLNVWFLWRDKCCQNFLYMYLIAYAWSNILDDSSCKFLIKSNFPPDHDILTFRSSNLSHSLDIVQLHKCVVTMLLSLYAISIFIWLVIDRNYWYSGPANLIAIDRDELLYVTMFGRREIVR